MYSLHVPFFFSESTPKGMSICDCLLPATSSATSLSDFHTHTNACVLCREHRQVEEKVAKSTGGNYPNATAIVDCIKFGLSSSKQVRVGGVCVLGACSPTSCIISLSFWSSTRGVCAVWLAAVRQVLGGGAVSLARILSCRRFPQIDSILLHPPSFSFSGSTVRLSWFRTFFASTR